MERSWRSVDPLVRSALHSLWTHMLNQSHWSIHPQPVQLTDTHSKHPDTVIIKWAQTDDQSLKSLVIWNGLIWNMFLFLVVNQSGLVKPLITVLSVPMHQQPQSALVILADHWSSKKVANGDSSVWPHGLMSTAEQLVFHKVGLMFNGQNTTHGWEKMLDSKHLIKHSLSWLYKL